ncbi:MAG: SAF domain-containing protein [Acidimicrobiales bacterium]|nr:SAF domain-containing protein [Acidimicrobiales bacterium]
MPVMTETTSTNGKGALSARRQGPAAPSAVQRHRQVPWIVAGVLLVVGCALAFGVASVRASHGEDVLALARSVPAGRVVQAGDLRVVKVTPTAGLDPVLAVSESSTVGRPAAVALVAGTLLTPADLGTPSGGSGDVVAVALKAGAYPPSLGPGGRVDVVPVVGGSSSGSAPISGQSGSIGAVVLSVNATLAGSSADAVVSLQVNPADADEVAALAAAGQIALVELPSGSGS